MNTEKKIEKEQVLQSSEQAIEVIQLEERLEMVQADSLVALASCCMDSKEEVKG